MITPLEGNSFSLPSMICLIIISFFSMPFLMDSTILGLGLIVLFSIKRALCRVMTLKYIKKANGLLSLTRILPINFYYVYHFELFNTLIAFSIQTNITFAPSVTFSYNGEFKENIKIHRMVGSDNAPRFLSLGRK